jgi:hypothetical protein
MDVGRERRRQPESSAGRTGGRWPARAQRLLESNHARCAEWLRAPLRKTLEDFDRLLFAQAEESRLPAEQQDCFASRQRLLQDREAFEQRFVAELAAAFDNLDTESDDDAADSLARQPLSLLDTVEHELTVAMNQVGARGEVRHSDVLHELGFRMAVLIGAPPLEGAALPLGPHALTQAFHRAGTPLELPLPHHLQLLQCFDQSVVQALAPLYDAVNAQLKADGILPKLRSISVPRHVGSRMRHAGAGADADHAPGQPPPSDAGGSGHSEPIQVLETLRDLLAQQRAQQGMARGRAGGRAATPDELQGALGALQQHLAAVTDHASRELRSAQRLQEELLVQLNAGKPEGAPRTELSGEQGDTVELVAMLFEQLGKQLQTGSNAHALLGDLQLPLLRMAVADRGFFEQHEHPARRLLDTVTTAANDWLDGTDDEASKPLADKLNQLVERTRVEPPSPGLYTTLLADIEHHLALLGRKAQAAERRNVEAAKGRERLQQARQRAAELMNERFAKTPPHGLLRVLLERAWSDVLALDLLNHGEHSEPFATQLAITDQLLGRLPVGDRLQLQVEVETSLQQIGMHVDEAVQVAQRLLGGAAEEPDGDAPSATDLALRLKQRQRLGEQRGQEPVATSVIPAAAPAAAASTPAATTAKATEPATTAKTAAPSTPAPAPAITGDAVPPTPVDPIEQRILQRLRQTSFGTWFEFAYASGQIVRRKLAWYSPLSGRCLLVTRRGQRSDETTLAQLAHEIASGRVREAPSLRESLLDRAWRGLTGNLRLPATTDRRANPRPEPDSA